MPSFQTPFRLAPVVGRCPAFLRGEGGSAIIFSLFIIIGGLIVCGLAVDLARTETQRVRMQSSLDRGVLASASLTQDLDSRAVVESYLRTSGVPVSALTRLESTRSDTANTVLAEASMSVNAIFAQLVGINDWNVRVSAVGQEAASTLELVLVIDISGSMRSSNRMVNARNAALGFVDHMFAEYPDGTLTVSIVPYSSAVVLPPDLVAQFDVTDDGADMNCLVLPSDAYTNRADFAQRTYRRMLDFEFYSTDGRFRYYYCPEDPSSEVLAWEQDQRAVENRVRGLDYYAYTGLNEAMRWGVAMLDENSQRIASGMIASGALPAALSGQPRPASDARNRKVIIAMTDGMISTGIDISPDYRTGPSGVFIDGNTIYLPRTEPGDWDRDRRRGEQYLTIPSYRFTNDPTGEEVDWPAVWKAIPVRTYAWMMTWNVRRYYALANEIFTYTDSSLAERQFQSACDLAMDAGVEVYTIGFEAPDRAADILSSCASSPGHFYEADGSELTEVYDAIARQLSALRLTQ